MVCRQLSRQYHHGGSSTSSSRSDASDNTQITAPSLYSQRSLVKYHNDRSGMYYDHHTHAEKSLAHQHLGTSRSSFGSVDAYASTSLSEEDLTPHSRFKVPLSQHEVYASCVIPSTPTDFADLFTSNRRLLIHHDDATSDGNMNLRIDTEGLGSHGHARQLTLFHLRMHDLKDRCFSLRRYCRDSGREICSSSRRPAPALPLTSPRTDIQPSLGHAFQQLRLNQEGLVSDRRGSLREESSFGSLKDESPLSSPTGLYPSKTSASPSDTVQIEFSNYARINLNKRRLKRSKRYEYEFWGTKYEWKRQIYRDGNIEEVSYHLISDKTSKSIAHITPEPLTAREAQEEEDFGGWVPPCSMRITDRSVFRGLTDVAE
jgi:hypothetical protein